MAAAGLLIAAIGFGIILANLKGIVLRQLRSSFPEMHISLDAVSLRPFSRLLRITGLQLSGGGGEKGSFVIMPKVDVRYRLDPFKGLILKSVKFPGVRANLRPGFGALLPSLAGPARTPLPAKKFKKFPVGPRIAKLSLTGSTLDFRIPDLHLGCSIEEATADSSSSGTLLDNTDFSLRLQGFSLNMPSFRLQDVQPRLSARVSRKPTGRRIDVVQGVFSIPDVVRADFSGGLSFEQSVLTAESEMRVRSFHLDDVLSLLKASFPELDSYRIGGSANARLQVHYRSGPRQPFSLSGDISLREGRASLPVPKPLIAEEVEADVPFRCSILDGKTTLTIGPDTQHLAGATLAAARVAYDEQELACDLLAIFKLYPGPQGDQVLKSLNASFRSHGGNVSARLSGNLQSDGVSLEGDVNVQDIGLDEVLCHFGVAKDTVWGNASGKAHLDCTTGPKATVTLKGELSLRVPEATVSLRKPLKVRGLEIIAPFEYSASSSVQQFGIEPSDSLPLGGAVTAQTIGYGERVAEDGTSTMQWSVSGVLANAVSSGNETTVSIESCRAYDGEVTGTVNIFSGKKSLNYDGKLQVEDLDLERLLKGLGVDTEKYYVNGLAEGSVTVSGKEGKWEKAKVVFSAIPPGGIVRIEDVEKLFDSIPGEAGKAALQGLKSGFTPQQWEKFVEGMKEFRYSVATVEMSYRPLRTRLGAGFRAEVELHLVGSGAGQAFDITIPLTWDVI